MCLGVPGQIVELRSSGDALVEFWGIRRPVRMEHLKEPVGAGDYVIEHAGYAVRLIPPADVADTLALYEVLLTEAGEDPIARDTALACLDGQLDPSH